MKLLILLFALLNICLAVPPLQIEEPLGYRDEIGSIDEEISGGKSEETVIPFYRLPSNFIPLDYTIKILPIMDETPEAGDRWTAPGSVTITVNCMQDTNVITLHSYLLTINSSSVQIRRKEDGEYLAIQMTDYDLDTHFYNITTQSTSPMIQGKLYEIFINYVAPISTDRANGLYRASYLVPGSSELKYMAATQLEPARARQVFPGFDEPRWKSVFYVTIGRNTNYLSLSNGNAIRIEKHETLKDWVWETYEPTAPMPTYLFAMAVADYDVAEANKDLYRRPVWVYAAPHLIRQGAGAYSAEISAKLMKYFEDFYVSEHPMSKVDSIVVPGKGGAMENYGLVTYGNFLMYIEGETTETQRRSLNSIIAHELAHQWFGNWVTCEWWSDIWLNEGFATYLSYIGEEVTYNEYMPRKYIQNRAVQSALKYDAGPKSHPLSSDKIFTLQEIDAHFDSIPYDKGASIIRMMEGFLTEATLNKGLRNYLEHKSHNVAVQRDLFDELQIVAVEDGVLPPNKNMVDIMETWTLQKGFPLVQVSRAGSSRVYISQERFQNSVPNKKREFDPNDLWEVPISIATKDNPNFQNHQPKEWLDKDVALKSIFHDTTKWIMINLEGTGFYRVLYDVSLTNLIHEQLNANFSVISPLSRSQLLDDYLTLAFQEYVNIESALKLTQYVAHDSDFTVWNAIFNNLRPIFNLFSGTPAFEPTKQYWEPRIGEALKHVGVRQPTGEKGIQVIFRSQLLDWACAMGNMNCIEYAADLLKQWQTNPTVNPYPIDLQAVLYCASIANGGEGVFNFFLGKYTATDTSEIQKSRIVTALACVKDGASLIHLLQLSVDETSGFTKADSVTVMTRVAANSVGRQLIITFINQSIDQIITYHGNPGPIGTVATTLGLYHGTNEELAELNKFIEDNSATLEPVRTTMDNAVRAIQANIVWMSKFYLPMKTWFETQV